MSNDTADRELFAETCCIIGDALDDIAEDEEADRFFGDTGFAVGPAPIMSENFLDDEDDDLPF